MGIRADHLEEGALIRRAESAIELLCARDFDSLSRMVPYALAYGRPQAAAIAEDVARCLEEAPSLGNELDAKNATFKVRYFAPNDIPLQAEIECRIRARAGDTLYVDLIVLDDGPMGLALEGLRAYRADSAA
jgi:hypothetical protein